MNRARRRLGRFRKGISRVFFSRGRSFFVFDLGLGGIFFNFSVERRKNG